MTKSVTKRGKRRYLVPLQEVSTFWVQEFPSRVKGPKLIFPKTYKHVFLIFCTQLFSLDPVLGFDRNLKNCTLWRLEQFSLIRYNATCWSAYPNAWTLPGSVWYIWLLFWYLLSPHQRLHSVMFTAQKRTRSTKYQMGPAAYQCMVTTQTKSGKNVLIRNKTKAGWKRGGHKRNDQRENWKRKNVPKGKKKETLVQAQEEKVQLQEGSFVPGMGGDHWGQRRHLPKRKENLKEEGTRESKERYHQNHKKNLPRRSPVKLAVGKEKRKSRRKAQEESSVQKEGRGGVKRKKGRFLKRWGGVLEVVGKGKGKTWAGNAKREPQCSLFSLF